LAGELLETFDDLGLGLITILDPMIKSDSRRSRFRSGQMVNPIFYGIQNELLPVIGRLENPNPLSRTGSGLSMKNSKVAPTYHPSILSLQPVAPIYSKALTKIAASRHSSK